MNTPLEKEPEQKESTVSIRSAHRWDTAFEGEVTDVHIDGTSMKMTTHLHGKLVENGEKIVENGEKIDQNWKYYRDQHRKTRRLLHGAVAIGLACFGILIFWVFWVSNSIKTEEVRKALDQIDAIHKKGGGGGGIRLISPLAPA